MQIVVLKEQARACGYRRPGTDGVGLYLMGDGIWVACERLPFPLTVCPCCGEGIRFSRGFTWIRPAALFAPDRQPKCSIGQPSMRDMFIANHWHEGCYLCAPPTIPHGLMWVGEKFYTPASFTVEAITRGISKRIASVPHGFQIGTHIVYLAHKKTAVSQNAASYGPGVFMVFKPSGLDIVVDTSDPEKLPARAVNLGQKYETVARIVKVEPQFSDQKLFANEEVENDRS